ncbi:MAG: hypothetical protein QOK21_2518 [Solirubrobacteraceae bacterium]|jgi:hypothetical protein|nr:hypothetical protein [Solirubrobacteraceae bacterium]
MRPPTTPDGRRRDPRTRPDGSDRHAIPVGAGRFSYAFEPSWSPDGRKLIFSRFAADRPRNGSEAIYTIDADGSGLKSTGLGGDWADWGARSGQHLAA